VKITVLTKYPYGEMLTMSTTSRSGYEIRTEILAMAKSLLLDEFASKYSGWEISSEKDEKGRILTLTTMPKFPTLPKILEVAKQMCDFVNKK